jgi:hypothetical protein
MVRRLALDPTGVEQGAARAKTALDTLTGKAVKAEAALDSIGGDHARRRGRFAKG